MRFMDDDMRWSIDKVKRMLLHWLIKDISIDDIPVNTSDIIS